MRYVVIGASAAGISGAKYLRELDKEAEIIVVSMDRAIVSRCMLHEYINGQKTKEELNFANPGDFFESYNMSWRSGTKVEALDVKEKSLSLSDGEQLKYDKLLVATGASAFVPPIAGLRETKNVVALRDFEDAEFIKETVPHIKNVVILGAGLVGIDAIDGILPYDVKITMLEMGSRIAPLQLDDYASEVYKKRLADRGVCVRLGVAMEKVIADEAGKVKEVGLSTGEILPCELLIVATGVRANVAFLKEAGVECDRFGLIINAKGETNTKDIYGAGDVTGRNPIWPVAVKAGKVAAYNMIGQEINMNDYFATKNTMRFVGLPTLSLGLPIKPDETFEETIYKEGEDYKKIIHKDGKIYGVILQGDLSYSGVFTQLVRFKLDTNFIDKVKYKIDYGDYFNVKQNQEYTY